MTRWFFLWLTLLLSRINYAVHFATSYDYTFQRNCLRSPASSSCVVAEEIKQQVLLAVPNRYFCVLEDDDYGYSDVSVLTILLHLKATYATIEPEEIETNRARLTAPGTQRTPSKNSGSASRRSNGSRLLPTKLLLTLLRFA
jgi:hypothetical protein